jgi:hypothetical protein
MERKQITEDERMKHTIKTISNKTLPTFKGYTIDQRLREFRAVSDIDGNPSIEFIPFASQEGIQILAEIGLEEIERIEKQRRMRA